MRPPLITWLQDHVADVPLRGFTGRAGDVIVGRCEYDGSNRLWTWWTPLAEDVWGHAPNAEAAQQHCELWLRDWLENFRGFFVTS
ncbi:hypothetical protein [Methylobacterium soli]|uniref:Uncharacterized protein n=1 Tax=Methylobacterium soli TaxID=553447 RepID=A0A6L3STJ9_9HYPH|nr:hypothetical protein [Methylobacterium soli]KAB1075385.1 hypothetical protein F6X53_24750 [Methylobacterium soli]GJE43791.1 hypothetical protein AEGHOMDF_2970 [Methylobacterium soli]